jgi:hypothetical protein
MTDRWSQLGQERLVGLGSSGARRRVLGVVSTAGRPRDHRFERGQRRDADLGDGLERAAASSPALQGQHEMSTASGLDLQRPAA